MKGGNYTLKCDHKSIKDMLSCGEAWGANKKTFMLPSLHIQDVNRLKDESALKKKQKTQN